MKSKQSKSGGGITSKNNVNVPVRTGKPAYGVSPGWSSQLGSAVGNKVTEEVGGKIPYRGEAMREGKSPISVPLGNQLVNNVGKGGPGTGRVVHSCGSQTGVSPTRSPVASGKDILGHYGPNTPLSGKR
jgi:hypothetical protein